MTSLHPTAVALAKAEDDYADALAKLATLKAIRRVKRTKHREAITKVLTEDPTVTNVDLAARFAVTEGTIRNIRSTLPPTTAGNQDRFRRGSGALVRNVRRTLPPTTP